MYKKKDNAFFLLNIFLSGLIILHIVSARVKQAIFWYALVCVGTH